MARPSRQNRRGGRRGSARAATGPAAAVVRPGLAGGGFRPLSDRDLEAVHRAALHILAEIGLSDAPLALVERAVAAGAAVGESGRLCFPAALVEEAIAGFRRDVVLHGSKPGHELTLSRNRVHVGTGGAAPNLIDIRTGAYRPSSLRDLYDAARLADALDNMHFFSRSLVARDMPTPRDLDINTAYACLAGTGKHVMVSASDGSHVAPIAEICALIAGGEAQFAARPFLSLNVNHVVPPLRFIPEACAVLEEAALRGVPVFVNSFDQAGASSPASLAGSLAQSVAETLAGMILVWIVNPDCPAIFGPRPLITDLRTGAMTGGCGEQAVLMAGAVQMAGYYDLPNSCIAGATDSKEPDAQSGYEKALSVSLAAHAGCTMITQAGGMHAALMGVALESYVIDNDMLGDILRSVRGIEVNEDNLALDTIAAVVAGEGHFLGERDTYARMQTDYLYPKLADRRSPEEWESAGRPGYRQRAADRTLKILADHWPDHLPAGADRAIRAKNDIRLPPVEELKRGGRNP